MSDLREIRVPEDLCKAAEKKLANRFKSVEELIIFLLSEISQDEAGQLDDREKRMIDERLKSLGYM